MTVLNLLQDYWLFTISSLWLQLFGTSRPNRDYKPFGKRSILPFLGYLTQEHPALWLKSPYCTLQYKWEMINSMHVSLHLELFPFTCFLGFVYSVCTKYVIGKLLPFVYRGLFFGVCVCSFLFGEQPSGIFPSCMKSLVSSVIDLKFGSLRTRQFLLHLFRNLAKLELNYVIFL